MSEESILILNMLREGKISAEQADSLLRAVRETAPPPVAPVPPVPPVAPAPPPPPPVQSAADAETLARMQNKLGELQGKIGELQGKLGAAQAARAAGQAASLAGKILDHVPRPDVDFSKIMDETMRGLNSLKNDAVRTAKVAGRQVAQEARRAAKQGRKAVKFDFEFTTNSSFSDRPDNETDKPEATERSESDITWTGASSALFVNKYGNVTVRGADRDAGTAHVSTIKTSWAGTDAEARIVLQQVFITSQVENGKCRVEVFAPADARDRLTVDYEAVVPRGFPIEIETTHGVIDTEGVSLRLKAQSESGRIHIRRPPIDATAGDTKLNSRSGDIIIEDWNTPLGGLAAETVSGDVRSAGLRCGLDATIATRSGEILLDNVNIEGQLSAETSSGDIAISGGTVHNRVSVKTQSGEAAITSLHAPEMQIETVSGDIVLADVAGTLIVRTVSGDIASEASQSQNVTVGTVSGDAHLTFTAPFSGTLAGTTVSGDFALKLASGSSAKADMTTTNGELTCPIAQSGQSIKTDRHFSGTIGDGTGSIRMQSISGDLKISE